MYVCCRSHKDLAKDATPHFRKAKKYYDGLAAEMVSHGHICDIFCAALDNVGHLHVLLNGGVLHLLLLLVLAIGCPFSLSVGGGCFYGCYCVLERHQLAAVTC